ncbi:MAG TPA: serine hydrolase domain-containing protein [Pyrinomonadaceae bacterium]|jgi:CubicO group peptidase (beta-lactamase class C family)|nr:serine hydrolase domain-containing protein [Pyrinomonadaceae bacterium]
MKKAIGVALVALLLNSATVFVFAQKDNGATEKDFNAAYEAQVRKMLATFPDLPGMAIVVIKDDRPIFVRAYGMADKEAAIKADNDTLYYIASSTKSFTALAAAMLDKEGQIKFSDPVTKYTPGIQFKNQIPDKITIRDLLTHTSGLRNTPLMNRLAFTGQIDQREIDHVFAAGTTFNEANFGKYAYTNLGYNIYGLALYYHLHKKWQDLLQERVFTPAGLAHTTAYVSKARAKKFKIAAPYVIDTDAANAGKMVRSQLEKTDDNMQSAGGIFMSVSDLGRWLNVNMNGGKLGGKQVFPADLIRNAHTGYTKSTRNEPPFSGDGEYGLGWQIGTYRNEKVIYHHGGYPGYRSHVSFMPDKKIAVGVLANNDILGGRLADLLAAYAYDWWLKTEDFEADYTKELQRTITVYESRKQGFAAEAAQRAKREWQLTRPFADYAGKYANDLAGTIDIVAMEKALAVRMGRMSAVATPYTDKDTIRIVMLPGGNGEVIGFTNNADGKPASLNWGGLTFTKVAK